MAPATARRSACSAFPTREETLALRASLLDGDAAIAAWRQLSVRSGCLEGGVAWITPLLLANLARFIPEDPFVRENPHYTAICQLKGLAMTQSAEATVRLLEGASIPTLALKGLALGATVYSFPGLRMVSDLDILVPEGDFLRAANVLEENSFRPASGAPVCPRDLRANHAHPFYSGKEHEPTVDLHWHVLASARGVGDDDPFWSEAQPLMIGGVRTRTLSAEDQLLHVIVHGVRWTRRPHVRWVADAALILRKTEGAFRTQRLLSLAEEFDVVTPVQEGLRFVAENLGEGRDLFEHAMKLKGSRFGARAFKARATAYEDRSVIDRIALRIESAVWSHRATRRGRPMIPKTTRPPGSPAAAAPPDRNSTAH